MGRTKKAEAVKQATNSDGLSFYFRSHQLFLRVSLHCHQLRSLVWGDKSRNRFRSLSFWETGPVAGINVWRDDTAANTHNVHPMFRIERKACLGSPIWWKPYCTVNLYGLIYFIELGLVSRLKHKIPVKQCKTWSLNRVKNLQTLKWSIFYPNWNTVYVFCRE